MREKNLGYPALPCGAFIRVFFPAAASSAIPEMAGGLAANRISLILSVRITIADFPFAIEAKIYGMFEFYWRKKNVFIRVCMLRIFQFYIFIFFILNRFKLTSLSLMYHLSSVGGIEGLDVQFNLITWPTV